MLSIILDKKGGLTERREFSQVQVFIGAHESCELSIQYRNILPIAAIIRRHGSRHSLETLDSRVRMNGRTVKGFFALTEFDLIEIGPYTISLDLSNNERLSDIERSLLNAIRDDATQLDNHLVYADWLEEQGDCDGAEYLRLVSSGPLLESAIEPSKLANLRALARRLEPTWRREISRLRIENCEHTDCPGDWSLLSSTTNDVVRRCTNCHKSVSYCRSVQEAKVLVSQRLPVVLDFTLERSPLDLFR